MKRSFTLIMLFWLGVAQVGLVSAEVPPGAAWHPVKIIDGGCMPSIVMHPLVPDLRYIRANIGGAYRWDAPEHLWTPITDWIAGPEYWLSGVESIAVDRNDINRVYIVTGMYLQWSSIPAAILISTNRGVDFQRVNLPFYMGGNDEGQQTGERLEVNPFNPRHLYLATHLNGLWQSKDYGASWSAVTNFPANTPPAGDMTGLSFVRFDPRRRGTVYVGAYTGGIYRSVDTGATWQRIPGQPTYLPGQSTNLFREPPFLRKGELARPMRSALDANGVLYVTYANTSGAQQISNGAVYKFDPRAGAWTNITPADPDGLSGYGFCGITVDPQHTGTVMVATWNREWVHSDTIFRSTDGGITWRSLGYYSVRDWSLSPFVCLDRTYALFGNFISSVEIDPFDSNHALYITGATVWETHDLLNADSGGTVHWTIGADGIEETAIFTLASPPQGAHLFSGMGDDCGFRHDDFDVSPVPFKNPWLQTVTSLDFSEVHPAFVVRVGLLDYYGHSGGAYSYDEGDTWTAFPSNAPGVGANPGMIAVSADGTAMVWAPSAGWWLPPAAPPAFSRNLGATWETCGGGVSNLWVVSDRVNSKKFYGFHGASGIMYVSTNWGATFLHTALVVPEQGTGITSQGYPRTVPGREGDIWIPTARGLYHSTDSGASFTRISSIGSTPLVGFGKAATTNGYPAIYAVGTVGGTYGIFRSDDEAATWVRINDDRHQFGLLSVITGDPRIYGRVYLGTTGRGILYADTANVVQQ